MKDKKVWFITLNDIPSGVYISQVIDVVRLYKSHNIEANLLAIIPIRNFFENRKKIKSYLNRARVYPAFPKLKNWRLNKFYLRLIDYGENTTLICRNIFSTNLAFRIPNQGQKIVYDGRGAISAEQNEYGVYSGTGLESEIFELEKMAVKHSNRQIAVSSKLVQYWRETFGSEASDAIVIPCNLSFDSNENFKTITKEQLGWNKDNVVLVYSGSGQGWQSMNYVKQVLVKLLKQDSQVCILFLAKESEELRELREIFGPRICIKWVNHNEVFSYLKLADYGLVLREYSITNSVASPVKIAEYLSAGLQVIISDKIGDYSEIIQHNKLGLVIKEDEIPIGLDCNKNKERIRDFALDRFSKSAPLIYNKYTSLLDEF